MDLSYIYELLVTHGTRLLLTLVFLLVGLKLITVLGNFISQKMSRRGVDPTLQPFIKALLRITLLVLLILSVASMVGIAITSFVAILGAVAFAIGFALQGSLANLAGGTLILLLKPFQVGDYIEAAGHAGTVDEIQFFYTMLNTPDNKKIIVPNAILSNSSTINYTANSTRRIDFVFGISYENSIEKARSVLQEIADNHPLLFNDPPPQIVVAEHGDSAIIIYMRVWCEKENYWPVYFEIQEKVKLAFDEAGITIPYPQTDVHLFNRQ